MTDLADGLVYSRSGLTCPAGQLEQAGLVTRSPGAEDERSVTVTLTGAGHAALERVMPGHVDVVQSLMFDVLTSEDVAVIGEILGRVRDRMRAAPPRSAAPRPHRRSPRT
jgi:DNA-binding MarR family transcriptional regulator